MVKELDIKTNSTFV